MIVITNFKFRKMRELYLILVAVALIFTACEKEDDPIIIEQGDYPVKEYYLERDPSVNVWGAGLDFVHEECALTETDLDYAYLTADDTFSYDINFYVVKAYYYDDAGDIQSEGCPAFLLSSNTKACKLGEGVAFFDSLTTITEDMIAQLEYEAEINYDELIDETTGFYDRDLLYAALEECVIGQSFRSNILVVPDGSTEEEVQAVYLVETVEGAYAKFMVKEFKPAQPNQKKSLVMWQVISE
jgi:hypothetical protein